ncbi:hypothetical protein ElyMa_000872400 [Elysia marginata]|uniref:Serine-threonine/tyrosine-protein kinase catalytic domain-containing protein n=1 Tax=Elysia marginata TaxID=1093978 RepID=A0AAV4H4E9_9GAST|nr:hypothetical protein ElyMa_000872400 [Elysia marginata]
MVVPKRPENILVLMAPNVKLSFYANREHVWTAPELLRGTHGVDRQKADIYSYGIVLYELLLKRKPYVTESNTRVLIEPHWESVIECVRVPDKLTEMLESSTTSDHISEVAEIDEASIEADSSVSLGRPPSQGPVLSAARSEISQGRSPSSAPGLKLKKHAQNVLYWNSFRHHFQRNQQNVLSHRMHSRSTQQMQSDGLEVGGRGKSTSVLLPGRQDDSNHLTPVRSRPMSPALRTESHRNRLYGTSRRSSCDSSLSAHAHTNLSPKLESEVSKVHSPFPPLTGLSNIHQSAAFHFPNVSRQNNVPLFQTPSQSLSQKKNTSPPRQRRNPRVSPYLGDDVHSHHALGNISENHETHQMATHLPVENETSSECFSADTKHKVGANNTGHTASSTVQSNLKTESPSATALGTLHGSDNHKNISGPKISSQSHRAASSLPGETSGQNISWAEPNLHSQTVVNTQAKAKDITSPKKRVSSLGEQKLLTISFPASPVVVPMGSHNHSSSCHQKVDPFSPDTPPSSCCCPKFKKSPTRSPKTQEKIFTCDLHLEPTYQGQMTKRNHHDLPENPAAFSSHCVGGVGMKSETADKTGENGRRVFSPTGSSNRAMSLASVPSRPSTGQLQRTASYMQQDKHPVLMRPEIPCWYRGSGARAGSISGTANAWPASSVLTNRGRAMSVDRSKLDINAPSVEGRASALDIFSRASFNTRRAFGSHAAVGGRAKDKEGQMLDLMKQCWAEEPELRPSADTIIKKIRGLTTGSNSIIIIIIIIIINIIVIIILTIIINNNNIISSSSSSTS